MSSKKRSLSIEEKAHLDIMRDIAITKSALDSAYSNFDNVTDPDLIDCYIYEVNAVQKRYKFLLEKAANLNIPISHMLHTETS
ncbi:MAG: YaaL family protein [Clostridia bacterium]|nr:YaaL family protein [Clostridia bacterium]